MFHFSKGVFLSLVIVIIEGCGSQPVVQPDPATVYTSAAETAAALLTGTSLAGTKTALARTSTPSTTLSFTSTLSPTPIGGGGGILAVVAFEDIFEGIYLMNVNSSDFINFYIPRYSPDVPPSEQIAYRTKPVWSPDGEHIAFQAGRYMLNPGPDFHSIYLIDLDGTNLTRLTFGGNEYGPTWSPDGTSIAYFSGGDIYSVSIETLQTTLLIDCGDHVCQYPIWSPKGEYIAYCDYYQGNYVIYMSNTDGSGKIPIYAGNPSDEGYCQLTWSPDGSRIAFVSEFEGNPEIYVTDIDGSNLVRLTNEPAMDGYPAWSPDGTRIAFCSERGGGRGIYIMNVDGSNVFSLTGEPDTWPPNKSWPAWQP